MDLPREGLSQFCLGCEFLGLFQPNEMFVLCADYAHHFIGAWSCKHSSFNHPTDIYEDLLFIKTVLGRVAKTYVLEN